MTEQGTFDTLEPIEKAGIDELRSLQLQRLKWSLEHAYANVESYRKKFDAAGVHPVRPERTQRPVQIPVYGQA